MDGVIYLKTGVKLENLYKDLEDDKMKQIEKASSNGFTEAELKKLEEAGIDTSIIKKNSTEEKTEDKKEKKTQSKADIKAKAKEIAKKYCKNLAANGGDPYSASNPELGALEKALNDGIMEELADEGFTKNQIIDIISQSFPSVGIKNTGEGNKYSIPHGHGAEAKGIYDKFVTSLLNAVGEGSEEIKAAKEKLSSINKQITDNNREMQALESEIVALQDEVEEQIENAIDESKKIAQEQKEDAKAVVKKQLDAYTSSNGEMTYDEFKKNVAGGLDTVAGTADSELGKVVLDIVDAQRKMGTLNQYVEKMGSLVQENIDLGKEAEAVQEEIDELVKEQEAKGKSADSDAEACDPIGFSSNTTRYDFFVDSDDNEDITNEQEFLGAKDGFNEVRALDTDGDGMVTGAEMDAADVKVIQTNADGTQEIKKASEVFTQAGDGIDLKSYESANEDIGNGNTLLGTFDAKLGGATQEGYQTFDTLDWLDENYEFTDEAVGVGRFAQGDEIAVKAEDFSAKVEEFTARNAELQTKLDEAWSTMGFEEAEIKSIISIQTQDASASGKSIKEKFDSIALKEEEKAQAAEAEAKAEEEVEEELEEKEEEK